MQVCRADIVYVCTHRHSALLAISPSNFILWLAYRILYISVASDRGIIIDRGIAAACTERGGLARSERGIIDNNIPIRYKMPI